MSFVKRLYSKDFFIFNLVLIGVIFGFSLAFLSFSCSAPQKKAGAQQSAVVIPQSSLETAEDLQNVFRAVAEKVQPSVVALRTESVQRQQVPQFDGVPWEWFFGPRGNEEQSPRQREYRAQGLGSGFIVRQSGDTYYVLTNNHVVAQADKISVEMNDGNATTYDAVVVGSDSRKDLALVSFTSKESYPLATLGNSEDVRVGDWAIALGNPLNFMFSVTMGIVSAVGRQGGPGSTINDFIQTDASINQGNSGGPLVNIRGEVIGINTWIASSTGGGSVGLGFASTINGAKRTIDEFIENGAVSYGWLGVTLQEAGRDMLDQLGVGGQQGALVTMLFTGSPADKGGVRPGDYVIRLNGEPVRSVPDLQMKVGDIKPGERAQFRVIRDKAEMDITVRIEQRDDKTAADNSKLWPGVSITPLTSSVREELDIGNAVEGVLAIGVTSASPAEIVGLSNRDIITAINGEPVRDAASFYKALREKTARELWFEVRRGTSTVETLRFKR
ncbi:MAG: Do family serine endopeptidase [Spirochaetaceae bacterium]|jgi:Do/DeqQ family serine protease|nr:Do family serine endopeptidase [Spirochaetaceae bacterium]